jgi:hypothetical protein
MRCRILAAIFAVVLAQPAYALPSLFVILPVTRTQPQVRTPRAPAAALLAAARDRSATVRRLLDEIAMTDVIVYVEVARDPRVPRARTALISTERRQRFLLVTLNPSFNEPMLVSLLGHELQHVLEIGRAHDVFDQDSLRRLYQRIGRDGAARDRFETSAADLAGRQVFSEAAASYKQHAMIVTASAGKVNQGMPSR